MIATLTFVETVIKTKIISNPSFFRYAVGTCTDVRQTGFSHQSIAYVTTVALIAVMDITLSIWDSNTKGTLTGINNTIRFYFIVIRSKIGITILTFVSVMLAA